MRASKVTAKHKDLVRLHFRNSIGGIFSVVHNFLRLVTNKPISLMCFHPHNIPLDADLQASHY